MTNCKNCQNQFEGNFCSNCGQPDKLKRIDAHYMSHEIQHLLHFEKGILYTAKELLLRPGNAIREFITENRNKHMKPIAFLIFTSILYTIVAHFLHADQLMNSKEQLYFGPDSVVTTLHHWVQTHYGYANILMAVFIAIFVKWLFKSYKINFYEVMVVLCFVMGQGMLILTILALFYNIISEGTFITILFIISCAYPTWAIGQFYNRSKVSSYVKAFVAYMLGYTAFYIALTIVGLIADTIIKS